MAFNDTNSPPTGVMTVNDNSMPIDWGFVGHQPIGTSAPAPEVFRTAAAHGGKSVDRAAGVIFGAKIIEAGQLNDDRPWLVDQTTLEQVEALGSTLGRTGVKARFTHPSMSDDGLGHFLGRWHNFRVQGNAVRADLHLSESAKTSPRGDLWTYVLDLATEDPEAFGVSVATILAPIMFEEDPELDPDTGLQPLRFEALRAADVVDEPAATRGGLFSESDPRDLPDVVARLIYQHFGPNPDPEIVMGRFRGLLARYCGEGKQMDKETKKDAKAQIDAAQLKDYVERFGTEKGLEWLLADRSLEDCYADALSAEKAAGAEAIAALKQDNADALDALKALHDDAAKKAADELAQVTRERDDALAKLAALELGEESPLDSTDRDTANKKAGGLASKIRFAGVN